MKHLLTKPKKIDTDKTKISAYNWDCWVASCWWCNEGCSDYCFVCAYTR